MKQFFLIIFFVFQLCFCFGQCYVKFGEKKYLLECDKEARYQSNDEQLYQLYKCRFVNSFKNKIRVPEYYSLNKKYVTVEHPPYTAMEITDGCEADTLIFLEQQIDSMFLDTSMSGYFNFKIVISGRECDVEGYSAYVVTEKTYVVQQTNLVEGDLLVNLIYECKKSKVKNPKIIFTDIYYSEDNAIYNLPFQLVCTIQQ